LSQHLKRKRTGEKAGTQSQILRLAQAKKGGGDLAAAANKLEKEIER
jgi:hypothetical protein